MFLDRYFENSDLPTQNMKIQAAEQDKRTLVRNPYEAHPKYPTVKTEYQQVHVP